MFIYVYGNSAVWTLLCAGLRRPCGVPGLCAGEVLCVHDNFLRCSSDIKVPCPLAMYVVLGSIVPSVGVNPSRPNLDIANKFTTGH